MNDSALYRFARDTGIKADDIARPYAQLTLANAMMVKDEIAVGEYISMRNQNNLSEVLIYRRSPFKSHDDSVIRWDGTSIDTSWYDDAKSNATVYYIQNPDQLAGFSKLVSNGVDFAGKTIKLVSNINLNNKKWAPIGYPRNVDGSRNPFRGIFDGCGYAIYNLAIIAAPDWEGVLPDLAFFDELEKATIKNVNFEQVRINDNRAVLGGVAAVSVVAKDTTFVNVTVSGRISGNVCASIALRAVDSTFYNCINRANIKIGSFSNGDVLMCGGIVAQLTVSKETADSIGSGQVRIFDKCYQEGDITATVNNDIAKLVLGHMYGEFVDERAGTNNTPVNILIDRCVIGNTPISVEDHGHRISTWGFFARMNGAVYGTNFHDQISSKIDMLDGVIGHTPIDVGVSIVRPTMSTVVNNMVIPGSLNTLRSKPYTRDFVTENSAPVSDEDGVINMSPYYVYVKRVSI